MDGEAGEHAEALEPGADDGDPVALRLRVGESHNSVDVGNVVCGHGGCVEPEGEGVVGSSEVVVDGSGNDDPHSGVGEEDDGNGDEHPGPSLAEKGVVVADTEAVADDGSTQGIHGAAKEEDEGGIGWFQMDLFQKEIHEVDIQHVLVCRLWKASKKPIINIYLPSSCSYNG